MSGIGFRILGPVEILHNGQKQGPTTAQQRCVLAMLLLDLDHVVPTGRLVSALWASDPPAAARNSIRVYVTKLRKLIAADPAVELVTVGEGWRLSCEAERVDLYRFRDLVARARSGPADQAGGLLREGLALWRGPALADVSGHRLTGAVIEGLENERLTATEDRIASDLRADAHQDVVSELLVLVAEHPLRERLAQLLMTALHRGGRTAEGLEVFRRMRKRLVDELGIEPSAALRGEHQRLLGAAGRLNVH
jgi:DNA-binding SARP family transcriptional activator